MMSKIKLLDDKTIQKIAAGEVVERPFSIVKEIVENSIDAKSTSITISIDNGGIDLIRIDDDGTGIEKDDIENAFTRHATSKIENFDDLYETFSMGFRGEALASIAECAKVEMATKTADDKIGCKVIYENGKKIEEKSVAMNRGTSISVSKLFEHMPVRRKFLKSSIYEANSITDLVQKLALGNPNISFKYIRDSKIIFNSLATDNYRNKLAKIINSELSKNVIQIEHKDESFSFHGYISNNKYYRTNRALQYIYVNNRIIESKDISKAIGDSYSQIIPNGRFPCFQLFIDIDPSFIDVNIHPNKKNIHFSNLDEILKVISSHVKDALEPKKLSSIYFENKNNDSLEKLYKTNSEEKYKDLLTNYRDFNFAKETSELYIKREKEEDSNLEKPSSTYMDDIDLQIEIEDDENLYKNHNDNNSPIVEQEVIEQIEIVNQPTVEEINNNNIIGNLKYLCSVFKTYLVFENITNEELFVFDQHASHERINYEIFRNKHENNCIDSQLLLVPEIVDLALNDFEVYKNNKNIFNELGFKIDEMGERTIVIREVPSYFSILSYKRLLIETLSDLSAEKNKEHGYISDIIIKKACKASVKSGDVLSKEEAVKLINNLFACKNPLTCPHGRPTYIIYNKYNLEKDFMRIK